MKRLFSRILILVFILSGICIPQVSASADEEDTEYKAQLLTSLGVLTSEMLADEEGRITRGEFCNIAMRMMGYPDAAVLSTEVQMFVDVPSNHYAAGSINLAYSKGIMTGSGARMFQPENAVTYEQALKIMVGVLGWTKYSDTDDIMSWSVNRAARLGIMKDISLSPTDDLTKDAMVALLYNCLECDALVAESLTANGTEAKVATLLEASFNAASASGIVTANALTGLKGEGTEKDDEIEIDGVRYSCGEIDAGKYLGFYVKFYYTKDKNDDTPRLLMIRNSGTKVTEINARDLKSFRNGQYTYYKENGSTAKINVSQSADIIYNGKSPVNVTENMYMPKTGSIRILSRKGGSTADVILIEDYYNLFVYNINRQDKILYDKYDAAKQINLGERPGQTNYDVVYADGEAADFDSVKKDTLVSVMKSDDGEYIKIVINSNKLMGTISSIYDDTLEMDGAKYYISKAYDTALQPALSSGEKGTLFLDMNGEAAVFIRETDGEYQYGYLINARVRDSMDDTVLIRLLTTQGVIEERALTRPITIDDSKFRKGDEVIAELSENSDIKQQIMRYVLNSDGEVRKIDLAYSSVPQTGEKADSLHLEYDSGTAEYEYKSYAGTFSGKVNIDDATVIFSVPEVKSLDDEVYGVESKSYFINDEPYRIKSYITETDSVVADAVVVVKGDATAISDMNSLGLVSSIYSGLDKDGGVRDMISVYNDGALKGLAFEKEETLKNADIEEGDVVRFALNGKGEINILEKTYDYSEDVMINSESHNNRLYNSKFKLIKCGLYNKSGKVLVVAPLDRVASGVISDYTKYTLVTMSNIYVYDKDARSNKAYIGTDSDFVDYLHAGGDFSRMFIRSEYAQPRDIIIYK